MRAALIVPHPLLYRAPAAPDPSGFTSPLLEHPSCSQVPRARVSRCVGTGDCNVIGAHWFYNKLVFKKVQALLGGKMKLAGTGSAPLAPKAQKFVQTAFNTPTRQGYGLTETCAVTTLQNACDNTAAVVGPPVGCCCIKLCVNGRLTRAARTQRESLDPASSGCRLQLAEARARSSLVLAGSTGPRATTSSPMRTTPRLACRAARS